MADKVKQVKFICPHCQHEILEALNVDVVVKYEITGLSENGNFEYNYDSPTISGGEVEHFACSYCGFALSDDEDMSFLTEPSDIIEWCKKNCEQDNG